MFQRLSEFLFSKALKTFPNPGWNLDRYGKYFHVWEGPGACRAEIDSF
jgi:hypothetical protein